MHLRQGDYRRPNALPAETLLKYLPRANKDKDDEDEVDGKGRFKHYLYTKECYLWGSDDFSQLYHSSVPFEKVPMEMVELDRTLKAHGDLVTWGLNDSGQLGHGHTKTLENPSFVTIQLGSRVFVSSVACGGSHTLVMSREGLVWSFGSNRYGQLGRGGGAFSMMGRGSSQRQARTDAPGLVDGLHNKKVCFIACGVDNSAAITADGECYLWGCNRNGQCAVSNDGVSLFTPTLVDLPGMHVDQVSCGPNHTLILSRRLDDLSITVVHGVGKADTGALGVEQTDDVTEPIEIPLHFSEATEHAIQVSCGDAHSSVLTDLGRVYSAGHNDNGQLGLVQIVNLTPEFVRVHSIDGAYSIACGSNHTIALLDAGLHVWGCGAQGQLGTNDLRTSSSPRVVDGFDPARVHFLRASASRSLVMNFTRRSNPSRIIINEILHSELLFIRNLTALSSIFWMALRIKLGSFIPTPSPSSLNDALGLIFGNVETLLEQARKFYHALVFHLQEVDYTATKVMVGFQFLQINVLSAFKTFIQLRANGQSVDALQRAKDNDPLLFKDCGEILAKTRTNDMGSDVEQLLKAPLDHVREYKNLFLKLAKTMTKDDPDFTNVVAACEEIKALRKLMRFELETTDRTKDFWKKNRSLRTLISPDKRFLADLTTRIILLKEYPMDRYSFLLFNTVLVIASYLEYYNSTTGADSSHIHFVLDLNVAWFYETQVDTELVIQTPENRYTLVFKDKQTKRECGELLHRTVTTLLQAVPENEPLLASGSLLKRVIPRYKFSRAHPVYSEGVYSGMWSEGKMQGNGVMTYSNGSIYDGEWADGLQHGEGTADDKANKTAYTGKWKAGKLHGTGQLKYIERKELYDGEFRDNRKHGFGVARGEHWRHVGFWKEDKYCGFGIHIYDRGDIYMGLWDAGLRDKVGWSLHKNGDTYFGEWNKDRPTGRGAYVYSNTNRQVTHYFKGWFGFADSQYPGELTMPGFKIQGSFTYVSDPLKLGFNGNIRSDPNKREPKPRDGDFKSDPNPGIEVTDGKEWLRFFVDHSFDDEKWKREKESTTLSDVPAILAKGSGHCLASFLDEFELIISSVCIGAHISSFDPKKPISPLSIKTGRAVLSKLVIDTNKFETHLVQGVLDYFGLVGQTDTPEFKKCVNDTHSAIHARVFPILWPLYRRVNFKDDDNYASKLQILTSFTDEQLLKALDVEQKYWLIAEVATTNSHAQNPTVAQISLAEMILSRSPSPVPFQQTGSCQVEPSRRDSFEATALSNPPNSSAATVLSDFIPGLTSSSPPEHTAPASAIPSHLASPTPSRAHPIPITPESSLSRVGSNPSLASQRSRDSLVASSYSRSSMSSSDLSAAIAESEMKFGGEEQIAFDDHIASMTTDEEIHVLSELEASEAGGETQPYFSAIQALRELSMATTPQSKISVLRRAFMLMNIAISRFWNNDPKKKLKSLDELLPVFMYITIRAQVPNLQSECNFISDFLSDSLVIGEAGMMTQTLGASLQHVLTYNWLQFFNVSYTIKEDAF